MVSTREEWIRRFFSSFSLIKKARPWRPRRVLHTNRESRTVHLARGLLSILKKKWFRKYGCNMFVTFANHMMLWNHNQKRRLLKIKSCMVLHQIARKEEHAKTVKSMLYQWYCHITALRKTKKRKRKQRKKKKINWTLLQRKEYENSLRSEVREADIVNVQSSVIKKKTSYKLRQLHHILQ